MVLGGLEIRINALELPPGVGGDVAAAHQLPDDLESIL
jgi:hypothetical protein